MLLIGTAVILFYRLDEGALGGSATPPAVGEAGEREYSTA